MKRADKHDESRVSARRQRVAFEAARLIAVHGMRDYHQAKLKAARTLGILDEASLPGNNEVHAQLRDYQRLFRGDEQARELRLRREAALRAMEFFQDFEPRLVGSVLDGTADANSAVSLQVFSDDAGEVARLLQEKDFRATSEEHRLRLGRDQHENFPAWALTVASLPFEITVLPTAMLRQPPLSPIDGKPMQRATLGALKKLLAED
jgi:hypothetical protein